MITQYSDFEKRQAELTEAEQPFVLATVIRTKDATSAKAGAKALIEADGTLVGWLGGGCVRRALGEAAADALREGKARLIRVKPAAEIEHGNNSGRDSDGVLQFKSSCPSGGSVEIFLEPVLPRAQLVVCGGSPIARAIADLGQWLGFSIVVAALPEDQDGFAQAARRIEDFDLSDLPAARERVLVVATQGKKDRAALRSALQVEALGHFFVGSRAKAAALKEALGRDGIDAARLAALRSPAGLDIGAIGPEEIALSVLTEIVALRRRAARPDREEPRQRPISVSNGS